jgi:predicted 2-oxoglutarate/Fe(II)-dependent dioxygenase YbiX
MLICLPDILSDTVSKTDVASFSATVRLTGVFRNLMRCWAEV